MFWTHFFHSAVEPDCETGPDSGCLESSSTASISCASISSSDFNGRSYPLPSVTWTDLS